MFDWRWHLNLIFVCPENREEPRPPYTRQVNDRLLPERRYAMSGRTEGIQEMGDSRADPIVEMKDPWVESVG